MTGTAEALPEVRIEATTKGFPAVSSPIALAAVPDQGWHLTDLQPPVLTLRASAVAHNVALMAAWCSDHDVELAPHGKTTMAPRLWAQQLAVGAWGISAAGTTQARVMRAAGVPRILIANQLVDPVSIAWVAAQLSDPDCTLLCQVDSLRGVSLLEGELARAGAVRPLPVLVELGHDGGRTGCRTIEEATDVARRVGDASMLELTGVSAFEGTVRHDRSADALDRVGAFLDRLADLVQRLIAAGTLDGANPAIVSAGGSLYFDLVVQRLRAHTWPDAAPVRIVLRAGSYVTHDNGLYETSSPFANDPDPARRFRAALQVWGSVLSMPEPDLAILGFGRRDVSFDDALPRPLVVRSGMGSRTGEIDPKDRLTCLKLNDQHAYCRLDPTLGLDVGDLVACGISHPCTAIDRWRVLPVLDDDDRVIDAIPTFF